MHKFEVIVLLVIGLVLTMPACAPVPNMGGEGQPCNNAGSCLPGLVCDLSKTPPICAKILDGGVDAGLDGAIDASNDSSDGSSDASDASSDTFYPPDGSTDASSDSGEDSGSDTGADGGVVCGPLNCPDGCCDIDELFLR